MATKFFIFVSAIGLINAASLPVLYSHHPPGHLIVPAPALGPPMNLQHPVPFRLLPKPLSAPPVLNGYAAAVAQNNPGHQQSLSLAQNGPGYEAAISSANSQGYGSALSSAHNAPGYQSAISLANSNGRYGNYGSSVAAALNNGAYKHSVAQSVQHNGNSFQNSGASSILAPGLQVAQSHAVSYGR